MIQMKTRPTGQILHIVTQSVIGFHHITCIRAEAPHCFILRPRPPSFRKLQILREKCRHGKCQFRAHCYSSAKNVWFSSITRGQEFQGHNWYRFTKRSHNTRGLTVRFQVAETFFGWCFSKNLLCVFFTSIALLNETAHWVHLFGDGAAISSAQRW